MAKKRKKRSKKNESSKKKAESKHEEKAGGLPDGFWQQAYAILLILLAILLLFGSLGAGGPMPVGLFDLARQGVGYMAYFFPVLLVFIAILKIKGTNHKLDRSTFFGLLIFIVAAAGFLHIMVSPEAAELSAQNGEGGGQLGYFNSNLILVLLNQITGAIVLMAVIVVAVHFVLKMPLTSVFRLIGVKAKPKDEEGDEKTLEAAKDEEESGEFKLNEGVPVAKFRRRSLKDSAEKADDSQDALTTTSDPNWNFPGVDLLNKKQDKADAGDVEGNARIIEETLADFGIKVQMQGANVGPRVTQYTLKPPSGVRLTKITALENNLALNLAAHSIRIEAPIPGQRAVGIEVPNQKAASVRMLDIFQSGDWKGSKSPLTFAIGKDIAGTAVIGELDRMPHLLIAGATGSGKSIMINSFITSLMYRNSPADLKLILVDPKQVELTPYNDIPHLLSPVITEPEKCISALKWATAEMDRRYSALAEAKKRNIAEYNKVKKEEGMPYIVIVIDELADLMMLAARDVEALIVRLAQKARAVGIHLVLATQRPSVDVITGLIKANIPARVAFTVASQVDSRTILDGGGAEKLLGSGDMLYITPELSKPRRIQGAFVDEKEVHGVTDFIRAERAPEYDDEVVTQVVQITRGGIVSDIDSSSDDSLYHDAVKVVLESGKASASLLQRRLRVGYARAARLIESMEDQGIVGPADGARPRDVLISSLEEFTGDGETQPES